MFGNIDFIIFVGICAVIFWMCMGKTEKEIKIISCGCEELQTWHPGQVDHKLKCPIFKSLNPTITKEELLKYEGFAV